MAKWPKTFRGESGCMNHVWTVHPRHMQQHRAPASDSDIQVSSPTPSRSSLPHSPVYQPQVGFHSPSLEIELPQEPQEGQQTLKTYHPFLNSEYYQLL